MNEQSENIYHVSERSFIVTLLLCIFLGYLGIHRFYAGKVGTGILMLVTCGLGGIWVIIDLILIILGVFKDKEGLPVKF
ncbi:MAG: TM2 domain-containing protein [bacterium]|nr:TM2 domain-containing protein [bacterium]